MNLFVLMGGLLALIPQCAQAVEPSLGVEFSRHDWELACDNTRTCRAAGYQKDDGGDMAVSVLLIRNAGANQAVKAQLMIGSYVEDEVVDKSPSSFKLRMRVNGRDVGAVAFSKSSLVADLSSKQISVLLAALARNSSIEWSRDEDVWRLSDKGAAAVLLKMDEFQGRIGTQGALIKKGSRSEETVLPPLPIPVVIKAALPKPLPGEEQRLANQLKNLRNTLRSSLKTGDDCPYLSEEDTGDSELTVIRLTDAKLLVSTPCWGGYNPSSGYWVANDKSPYHPILVTSSGSEYENGTIFASRKGRGLGDCWSSDEWTWNGKEFVHTSSSSTGMCKLLAPGGAWSLPTITTTVR